MNPLHSSQRRSGVWRRSTFAAILLLAASGLAGCDSIKRRLNPPTGDPVWQGDSSLVAGHPDIVYRVVRDKAGTKIVPVATGGTTGFEPMFMSDRGWRLLDLEYMHSGKTVVPVRNGDLLPPVGIRRGMWEGAALDTLAGCQVMPPAALVDLPADVQLVASGKNLKPAAVAPLDAGTRDGALSSIATLIAPSAGVAPSMIGRYDRAVYVVPTGASRTETIVVTYDDPEALPDSVPPIAQRPRQLIVVLDKGVYGFKPTYVFKTVGNAKDLARRRFLGAFDADHDGRAELFFGLQDPKWTLVTYALKWDVDAWHEQFKYERSRCHG
jgi:hypothetical protein